MFIQPAPPPEPPAITAQQQADLDCVSVGLTLSGGLRGRSPWDGRLVRYYLGRLTLSDRDRDWRTLVVPMPDDTSYRRFMERLEECRQRLPAGARAR